MHADPLARPAFLHLGPVSDQLLISASDQQQQCERHLRCYLARGLRTSQLMAAV